MPREVARDGRDARDARETRDNQPVVRQWFVSAEGIDRHVISTDIQRYLGNDATVRPGLGTGEFQGVQGYWIKAYRNLTSAMIADLRADSARWRQEQRQTGSGDSYLGSRTYDQSNAARPGFRRDGGNNSPIVDDYAERAGGAQGRPHDPMQVDPPGRGQNPYGQPYAAPDPRGGQYPADPNRGYPQPGRGQAYPDQAMVETYGQPDNYGRFQVNPYGQDRPPQSYRPPQGPPMGYTQQGEYYVPVSSAASYQQPGMMPTAPAYPQYDARQQQPPPQAGQPGRGQQSGYPPQDYNPNPYPSPAQTIPDVNSGRGGAGPSGYGGYAQGQYDQSGRPVSNPNYGQQYSSEPSYPPQGRDPNARQQQPAPAQQRDSDRRHRRNG